jgi:hypothetical protein
LLRSATPMKKKVNPFRTTSPTTSSSMTRSDNGVTTRLDQLDARMSALFPESSSKIVGMVSTCVS